MKFKGSPINFSMAKVIHVLEAPKIVAISVHTVVYHTPTLQSWQNCG